MNHTSTSSERDSHGEAVQSTPLANPRRTRLGADGRPIAGPVTTTSN